ncbi:MAG: trypsin-like peptidase domain-containing protein, partial [Anaerolineales bacterium]|nr:trypsin-like peptidase domain-containing protein [Anaerolineales bacterium]
DTLVHVYEAVSPSVVYIQTQGGTGSGFVWDLEGHIVTNNHVVAGATQIVIVFSDGRFANASIVGTDVDSDLAVLKLDTIPTQLVPVSVGDSTQLKVGEIAIAIGSPFGQTGTMTVGFISALGRLQPVDTSNGAAASFNMSDLIQTDAAINPGNSGGVLVDENGLLIGVTSSIISPVRGSTGIGLAIPSVAVSRIAPSLIATGSYAHPYLGVSGGTLTPERASALGLPADTQGTLLMEVVANGPAAQAGLRGSETNGDVIVAINGTAVNSMDELITYLARYGVAGENVTLTILRDGQQQEIAVQLGARPGA